MKSRMLNIRLDQNEENKVKEMARCEGLTVSELVREALKEYERHFMAVDLFAIAPYKEEREPLGKYYFMRPQGISQGGDDLMKKAIEKTGSKHALICTNDAIVDHFMDELRL
jgi:hypothetical protein